MKNLKLPTIFYVLISCIVLNGCSAVMAGKRSTYRGDPKVLAVGQTRTVVEAELGAPDMSSPLEGNKQRVIYKMDPDAHTRGAKNAAVAGHIVADILTLGLWEVAGTPTELAAQDQIHNYIVIYNAAGIIESVEVLK
jgi:PBP1b-binding outer membrane lipoprotein LpoB